MTRVEAPLPVLAVTTRGNASSAARPQSQTVADAVTEVVIAAVAALRQAAEHLHVGVVAGPVRVHHDDDQIIEVCLPIDALPEQDPPPPIAAEVLTPGTIVEQLTLG